MRNLAAESDVPASEMEQSRIRVGLAIREHRRAAGLSLSILAGTLNVSISTMSKIENGKFPISFERLQAIADTLKIDLVQLLGQQNGLEPSSPSAHGMRRAITRHPSVEAVDAGSYVEFYHATDMLNKTFQPIIAELLASSLEEYGQFTSHKGEEWNYVIEGELDFHTDVYAPVHLKAGDSIYFDAEMKHAHIKVGDSPCRLVAILSPRGARTEEISAPIAAMLRIVRAGVDPPGGRG